MAKITVKENIHIEVTPYIWGSQDEDHAIDKCKQIIAGILRHVDDVEDCDVVWETNNYCEFCGAEWEVWEGQNDPGYPDGMPACCDAAIEEWEANNK
jgi:hypothetical protein